MTGLELESSHVALLESGCSLVVGTCDHAFAPWATRGWGLTVLQRSGALRVRLLLDSYDETTLANLSETRSIAITASDIPTLRTMQLKGRAGETEELTEEDHAKAARYRRQFFGAIARVDRYPLKLVERIARVGLLATEVDITDIFDQTPGPRAGEPIATRT